MSARVTTHTPFTDKECLLDALDELGVKYTLLENMIITDRVDFYGAEIFILKNGEYGFMHDSTAQCNSFIEMKLDGTEKVISNRGGITITSGKIPKDITPEMVKEYPWNRSHLKSWMSVGDFLNEVNLKYKELWSKRLQTLTEIELEKEMEMKKQIVETKRQQILENAKQKGYAVKEIKNGKQVQLVLTRTSY